MNAFVLMAIEANQRMLFVKFAIKAGNYYCYYITLVQLVH